MGSRPSFPTQAPEVRPYTKDSVFRADLDDDDEELLDDVEPDADGSDVAEASGVDSPLDDEDPSEDR
jgi:hypothetical protein